MFDLHSPYKRTKSVSSFTSIKRIELLDRLHDIVELHVVQTNPWTTMKTALVKLTKNLQKYHDYLVAQADNCAVNHNRSKPAQSVEHISFVALGKHIGKFDPDVAKIRNSLLNAQPREPVLLNEILADMPRRDRYSLLKTMSFMFPAAMWSRDVGGIVMKMSWIWKMSSALLEEERANQHNTIVTQLRETLSKQYARAVRAEYKSLIRYVSYVPVHVAEWIMRELTNDESADENRLTKEMQARVQFAVNTEDADVIYNLWATNSRNPSQAFDSFWKALNAILNDTTVAPIRRHGCTAYIPLGVPPI